MSTKTRKSRGNPKTTRNTRKNEDHGKDRVSCAECKKEIIEKDEALFVEEEVGRFFCQESCIVAHFTPEIEKLEREYSRHVSANDLTGDQREKYAHFRWTTLEKPDEVWVEKTPSGDSRHILISEFKPEKESVFAVAICLMLRDEPSFLYLAFITNDRYLVDAFRRGEQVKVIRKNSLDVEPHPERPVPGEADRLAEPWTEADSVRAAIIKCRKGNDIPVEDFGFYQNCLEETLKEPTELWSYQPKSAKRVYHFIRRYDHEQDYWYVVMAKDTVDETQIEIVDAFPTKDESLIQMCRHGKKEVFGEEAERAEAVEPALSASGKRNVH